MKTNFKLNKKDKKKWIEALRSGNYIQGERYLKLKCDGEYNYCCLGVARELKLTKKHWSSNEIVSEKFLPRDIQCFLSCRNDGFDFETSRKSPKWSFKKIANWIEKNL